MQSGKARILVLGPTPPPYHGVATFTRDLLSAQAGDLQLVHLDTSDRRDAGNLGKWDPRNIELGFSNLGELALRALRQRPAIVYIPISQSAPAFLRDALFALQARALGCRVVLHLHGGYFRTLYESAGAAFRATADRTLSAASAVIVLGENLRAIFTGLIPPERVHVVENGVPDPGAWELRTKHGTDFPTVAFMSTLTPEKGVLETLQACAQLTPRFPELRLRIAGGFADAETETALQSEIRRAGLNALRVDWLGPVVGAEKAGFLAQADVFCLPTRYRYEGQPLVLLEALAAGLPVVSTQHAAIPSTIESQHTGILTPANPTPEQIASALADILADRARHDAMAQSCRDAYLKNYTLAACHRRLFDVFRAVLRER